MRSARLLTAVAVAGAFTLGAASAASAQQPEPVVPQEQEAIEVTDELVDQWIAIYPAVVEVAQATQAELATAQTPEEAQAIQAEAQEQITMVLEEGDMTVMEYEAVVTRLNDDPELLAEVQQKLEAEQSGNPDGQR